MKKTLLLGLMMLAGISANAQTPGDDTPLADGSIAPDFTANDIYGNPHSLYADYLDQGKSVIIDFSATWCGPCWNYHQTHAMADLYEAYGPEGSDEIMVIFVEGDVENTTYENIFGEQGPIAPSQGNWTIGSPYPIIEDTEALNLNVGYDVDYFPTMYMICADNKQTTSVDQQTAIQLRNSLNNGCQTLTGLANHGRLDQGNSIRVCESGVTENVQAKLKNFGNNAITSATVVIKENGTVIATKDYAGNLNQFANAATITLNNIAFNSGSAYTMEVTSINGATPANTDLTTANIAFTIADEGESNNVKVVVHTDHYPSEASWQIKDEAGTVVASGGPYPAGDEDEWGGGGDYADTDLEHWVTLPTGAPQCYTVVLKDSFNDGWQFGSTDHGIEIFSNNELIYQRFGVGNFGTSLSLPRAFTTTGEALGSENFTETTKFSVYPNPSNGIFNFVTGEEVAVTVMDVTGKVVFTAKAVNNGGSIDLSSLQSGMYIAKIKGASSERIEKLVIK